LKIEAKQLVEISGVLAVVLSLAFVGMQLLLDRRVAIAEQYANRAESQRADWRSQMESENYFIIQEEKWSRGDRPYWFNDDIADFAEDKIDSGEMSVRELHYDVLQALIAVIAFDNLYFQYNQGLLPLEDWQVYRYNLKERLDLLIIDRYIFLADQRPIGSVAHELVNELQSQ